jgi:hypothetical protein
MTSFNHSDRLERLSKAMAMLTTLGILLIAVAMVLVFLIPDWTRNLLLARLGQAGHDLSLSPGRLIAAAAITAVPVGVLLFGLWQVRALFLNFASGHVFTLDNPPGSRQLVIALSVHDYLALIVGGVLLAVAWVMVEATRIADENASFV